LPAQNSTSLNHNFEQMTGTIGEKQNSHGDDPPTTPMIRERDIRLDIAILCPEPILYLAYLLIELTLRNGSTLIAGPSADSTTQRATAKICFTLFSGNFLNPSDDSNLAMNLAPVKGERCVRIYIQLA
jgi:hypothetical protein